MTYQRPRRVQAALKVNTRNHFAVGFVWIVQGSQKTPYEIKMLDEGFSCTCPGFYGHGYCKHCRQIDDLLGNDDDVPHYRNPG